MNKYAKIYLEALKTANQSIIAAVFPGFNKVIDMVKDYQKDRRSLMGVSPIGKPMISLPKEVPQVDVHGALQSIPKPPKIDFK